MLPRPPSYVILATLVFPLMFTPGIMSVFHLILFPAFFSDIHPEHNKTT